MNPVIKRYLSDCKRQVRTQDARIRDGLRTIEKETEALGRAKAARAAALDAIEIIRAGLAEQEG